MSNKNFFPERIPGKKPTKKDIKELLELASKIKAAKEDKFCKACEHAPCICSE